jgi:hypothetical protein
MADAMDIREADLRQIAQAKHLGDILDEPERGHQGLPHHTRSGGRQLSGSLPVSTRFDVLIFTMEMEHWGILRSALRPSSAPILNP